ncbi:MAG: hypothetical protein ACKV2T_27125 [Kofleriaceae bacterium]
MAACIGCSTELDDIVCPRCSPSVDDTAFDEIERHTLWHRARSHKPISGLTKIALMATGIFGVFGLLLREDTVGLALFGPLTALTVVGAIYAQTRPLSCFPGVVLARAYSKSRNSKGISSTQDYLHLQVRAGALSFIADEKISGLKPGDAVIAFARGSQLDDVWPVPIVTAPNATAPISTAPIATAPVATAPVATAPIAAVTTMEHVPTPPTPPTPIVASTFAARREADIESAEKTRLRIDHADAARVRETVITRPWKLYFGPLMVAGVGILMFLCIPIADVLDENPDVEGKAARMSIIYMGGACVLGVFLLWAGLLARSIRNKPIVRTLCVAYGERFTSDGSATRREIAILDEHQRLDELPVFDKALDVPIGEPLILFVHDRRILAAMPVATRSSMTMTGS